MNKKLSLGGYPFKVILGQGASRDNIVDMRMNSFNWGMHLTQPPTRYSGIVWRTIRAR